MEDNKESANVSDLIKKSNIYTKTGDKGTTSLYNGKRVKKDCVYIEVVGEIDEINTFIGLLITNMKKEIIKTISGGEYLLEKNYQEEKGFNEKIQSILFDIGSHIATPLTNSSENKIKRTEFD